MVSKNQKKFIKSLSLKKYRKQHGLFVAEGSKLIQELINLELKLHALITIHPEDFSAPADLIQQCTASELKSISFLKNAQKALAIFEIPVAINLEIKGLVLALDGIQDPGNLGTLIRLCDWFGVQHIVCSQDTVDAYNPKVVQATMGSIGRVQVHYQNLESFIKNLPDKHPVYGAFMHGDSIYSAQLKTPSVLILGNEGSGISDQINSLIKQRITIPKFNKGNSIESLNVATAGAILLSEFRRI